MNHESKNVMYVYKQGSSLRIPNKLISVSSTTIFGTFKYISTFQAGLTVTEVHFKQEEEDNEPEPLKMKHFYFPLGVLLGGLILSAIFLLIEIMIHRLRKPKTDTLKARLEEPDVTQSTPESEDGHNSDV